MKGFTVYKVWGEAFEISEEPVVYSSKELALKGAKEWEGFLGMSVGEALRRGEIMIEEWLLT
jgi:hypothetical protein